METRCLMRLIFFDDDIPPDIDDDLPEDVDVVEPTIKGGDSQK